MSHFQLFDAVKLRERVPLPEGGTAPAGTPGSIVEILGGGKAYLVELFGEWIKVDDGGNLTTASPEEPEAFQKTLDVVTVSPEQIELVQPALETVGAETHLLAILDDLPRELVAEVVDFAQFLRQKQQKLAS